MRIGQAKGAQIGNSNTQHNTYTTQKHTKIAIPVIGPLFTFASVHPVIAVTTAAVVLGGTGAVASGTMSSSDSSTHLTRAFHLTEADNGQAPVGYDFSHTPPVLAGPNADAIYVQGGFFYSTAGKLAPWRQNSNPTAAQCRDAIAKQAVRTLVTEVGSVTCYLDSNGGVGYFTLTSNQMSYVTIDTAHLG